MHASMTHTMCNHSCHAWTFHASTLLNTLLLQTAEMQYDRGDESRTNDLKAQNLTKGECELKGDLTKQECSYDLLASPLLKP